MSNIYHNSRKSSERPVPAKHQLIASRLYLLPSAVEVLEELERRIDPQALHQVVANQLQETMVTAVEQPVAAIIPVEEAPVIDADRLASAEQQVREAFENGLAA